MSKLFNLTLLISFIFLFSACETDFNPNAEYKDISVVYGILNQNDSITYIKVNKAFLGEKNAYTMAQYEDSSSYGNNLEVKMDEFVNDVVVNSFTFDTATIYNKEPGVFYAPNQVVYKCITYKQLHSGSEYKLSIRNKKTGKIISSSTGLISSLTITNPYYSGIYFDLPSSGKRIIEWKSSKNGKTYQLNLRFNYFEDGNPKFIDMKFPTQKSKNLDGGEILRVEFPSSFFFSTLRSNIPVVPGMIRKTGKVELTVAVAADDFSTYLDVNAPSGSIVQVRPEFTNISNGIGIFSARYDNSIDRPCRLDLGSKTNDSLKFGQYTRELGFQ